jgi:hypothetical protein
MLSSLLRLPVSIAPQPERPDFPLVSPGLLTRLSIESHARTCTVLAVLATSSGRGIVRREANMTEQTRRYSIRLTDLEAGRDVGLHRRGTD